jgi:predicted nucleic acid-binding protein
VAEGAARGRKGLIVWVVDSNLLLDVALDDPAFRAGSLELLRKRRSRGLVVCPVTVVEISPSFGGDAAGIRDFLDALAVAGDELWSERDTAGACVAWTRHISQRRTRIAAKRPIADVLIGAFAERFDGLLTRNPADFRALFPDLKLEAP